MAGVKSGVWLAAVLIPLQIVAGDLHGLNTLEHQPAKVAAMEGLWETERGAPLVLFGIPDEETRTNKLAIEIPKLASLILTHELDGEVKGINEFADAHPPVGPVFWSFRIMVATGMLMLLVSWSALFLLRRYGMSRVLAAALAGMTFSGWVAVLSGGDTTEIGRQPYLVTGVMRTGEAVGPASAGTVMTTLVAWLSLYAFLTAAYIAVLFYLARTAGAKELQPRGINAHGPRVAPLVEPVPAGV